MEYKIQVGEKQIILEHADFDDVINVDDLTIVNTSNIFGDAVTISAATNRVGLLKAEVEATLAEKKLELKIFEGKFRAKLRKQAVENSGFFFLDVEGEKVKVKLSEKALDTCFETDLDWIKLKKEYIKAEKDFNDLSSLLWATQDKCRKLNNLVSKTTPEEFVEEMIEGKINGILIKK